MLLRLLQEAGLTTVIIRILGIIGIAYAISLGALALILRSRIPRGLQRLGLSHSRFAVSQGQPGRDAAEKNSDAGTGPPRVKALFIHPIKSCKPIELTRSVVTKTGLAFDRCFAFAGEEKADPTKHETSSTWRLLTQRTKPQMSAITVELFVPSQDADHLRLEHQAGGLVVIRFPNPDAPTVRERFDHFLETWKWSPTTQIRFTVPLMPSEAQIERHKLQRKPFALHVRTAYGLDLSALPNVSAVLPKLKKFLKIPARQGLTLLRCTEHTLHPTTLNKAPLENIGTPSMHGYTDQQPVHIINLSSVRAVSKLLPSENQPLDPCRFRANIYFDGDAPAYDEEEWKRCRVLHSTTRAALQLSVVCRTSRCTMPNVIPGTASFDTAKPPPGRKKGKPQPSSTLVDYRTVEDGNPAALGYLGMHCVPEDESLLLARGEESPKPRMVFIQVGDEIEVLERGEHLYGSTGDLY